MEIPVLSIIGAPRSGTSILGRVLDRHPQISTWVEPYYIWDYHFREACHDELGAGDINEEVRTRIRMAFLHYRKRLKADLIVDKSPRNSLKIPFIRGIFPEARYIFLFRDARDTILSIRRQWEGKKEIFGGSGREGRWKKRIRVIARWLKRRPLWKHRFQSLIFEMGAPKTWFNGRFLPGIRWEGRFGWGPRFIGWQGLIDRVSTLEFSAYQWVHCANRMLENIPLIPEDQYLILRYEDFTENPERSLKDIFSFLGMKITEGFIKEVPGIWRNNSNKWLKEMSAEDKSKIGPIISKTLIDTGYEKNESWYDKI